MAVMDEFNRAHFERARVKYNRCAYKDMSTDDWVSLVEGYSEQVDELKAELGELKDTCVCGASG